MAVPIQVVPAHTCSPHTRHVRFPHRLLSYALPTPSAFLPDRSIPLLLEAAFMVIPCLYTGKNGILSVYSTSRQIFPDGSGAFASFTVTWSTSFSAFPWIHSPAVAPERSSTYPLDRPPSPSTAPPAEPDPFPVPHRSQVPAPSDTQPDLILR